MSQNADESDLKEDYPSQLRDSLRCQILLKLVLRLPRLTVIPRTVFEHMPLLEVLDLSGTSIQSLPSSVSSLSSLKELLLRDCSFLIELPIEIGMLTKLKLLDIEGSEIMYIPKEIVELTDLEVLRLCLSQYAEYYIKAKNVNGGVKVPRMMISELKKLKELCISVCQEAEWWEEEIKEFQDEICHLENLEFLKWYLPTDTTLKQFLDIQINRKPAYEKLSNFTFTIGQHAQLTSCLPRGLEKKFAEFEKCLKWINAEGNIYDISKIMTRAKALFLSRHWTIVNLSAFDISKLKYFLLAECNEMETLVKIDDLPEVVENNKKGGLESLEYLSIHCMEKLKSIWEGPIGKDSLSRLRILALHTCLELTAIFTPRIAQNLSCLAELTVEECPKVRSLISTPHSEHGSLFPSSLISTPHSENGPLFPSLERILLIDLPELDHIFGGLIVLENLESLMIYNCVKLRHLSEMELPRIQKIKGENKWWNSLNAYAPAWENVFEPLKEKSELIKQLLEATKSLQHFHDVVSREAKDKKPLDGPGLGAQETKTDPFNFPLRKEEGRFHTLPETNSAQEETTTVQVDDIEGHDDEEVEEIEETISVQESNVSKSPSKKNDALAVEDVGNGDIKGALETVTVNESGEAVTALISCENESPLAVEDESKEGIDDDNEKNADIAEDDVDNKGDEDVSLIDNNIDENPEIYVGKLDKDIVEDDLVNVFQQFGELESTRIVRNAGKKSKGFGFVRFASVDQATRALSELKDGVEVRGKLVKVSKSQNNRTLFLGNISKTWSKEEVLQQLAQYGIEHIETIRVPEDISYNRKIKAEDKKKTKGFAFLEFSTHSEAAAAFQRLKKPDVVFGRDVSAKVSFEQSVKPSTDEDVPQVNRVHVAGLAKHWNEENVKEICEKYGEIVKIDLHISSKPKHKDFGFVTFSSPKSAQACVEGINATGIVGETEIIASIARATKPQKQGLHGGVKVEKKNEATKLYKEGEVSNKASEPNSIIKIKGVLNSQQTNINGKDSSKNKTEAGIVKPQQKGLVKKQNSGEAVKGEKQNQPLKKDDESSKPKNKRKASSEKNSIAPPDLRKGGQGNSKKPKKGGEGQNSKTNPKAGNNKRKKGPAYEGREDRDNRNAHGKKPLKKHKGSIHGRERDNYRNPQSDAHVIWGHDDYRNSTRYVDPFAPTYAASTPATYHLGSDSVSTRRRQEMEPHAGYIQPAAKQSQSDSAYILPTVRQHQPVYLEPASTSQSYSRYLDHPVMTQSHRRYIETPVAPEVQPHLEPASTSQSYSRYLESKYLDHPVMTQSHRRYIETPVAPEVQPYRGYRQSEIVQIAHDSYDPGLTRVVRQDDRGSGVLSYVGGPSLPASHVPNPTSYYQSGSRYSGEYGIGRPYY